MQLYLALAIPILLATAWLYTAQVTRTSLPSLRNKRICLLIAHPDDEAMFFSPTLLALTAPETGNHVKILCLSSGNADGLGEIRKQELAASGAMLGLRSASDVLVINDRKFPDSMTTTWPADKIAQILSSAFSPVSNSTKKNSPSDEPTSTIDTLITFDARGISSHLNHISLYHGARHWLSSLMAGKSGWKCPVELYTLTTTNILRKYISAFDAPVTMVLGGWRAAGKAQRKGKEEPPSLLFFTYADLRPTTSLFTVLMVQPENPISRAWLESTLQIVLQSNHPLESPFTEGLLFTGASASEVEMQQEARDVIQQQNA